MHEAQPGLREELLARNAEDAFPGGVQADEVAVQPRDAEEVQRQAEEAVQFLLDPLPVDEQADLTADRRQCGEQLFVRLADFAAEELHDAEHLAIAKDGEAERAVEARPVGDGCPGEIRVVHDVRNPRRLA